MKSHFPNSLTPSRGFSLIELIVSVGIFSIVATFAIGTLLTLTNAQRKAAALQSAFDNVRFGLESMSKDMRTGTNYVCLNTDGTPTSPPYPCSRFQYKNANNEIVEYRVNANRLQKMVASGAFQDISDRSIVIDQLNFYLVKEETGDSAQPTVTISVHGVAGRSRANIESQIHLQTSVTPRKLQP